MPNSTERVETRRNFRHKAASAPRTHSLQGTRAEHTIFDGRHIRGHTARCPASRRRALNQSHASQFLTSNKYPTTGKSIGCEQYKSSPSSTVWKLTSGSTWGVRRLYQQSRWRTSGSSPLGWVTVRMIRRRIPAAKMAGARAGTTCVRIAVCLLVLRPFPPNLPRTRAAAP